jgi:hypothetical protein
MSFTKCVRAGLLALIPVVAIACTNDIAGPTAPAARPAAAGPSAGAQPNLRSGYVLASGRG